MVWIFQLNPLYIEKIERMGINESPNSELIYGKQASKDWYFRYNTQMTDLILL